MIKLLKDKNATIGLADAGAHLHLFCDADFGLIFWPLDPSGATSPCQRPWAALTSVQAEIYDI